MNQVSCICFTDIANSSALTEVLGHATFSSIRQQYLDVGRNLASIVNGRYVKDLGDAHLCSFIDPESALHFTTMLQQLYSCQNAFNYTGLKARAGIFLGVIEQTPVDIFGSGVNQAARVEGHTSIGETWVNIEFVNAINNIWGKPKTELYFNEIGDFTLKGISDPPTQKLFSFQWKKYSDENPEKCLAQIIMNFYQEASVVCSNLPIKDLAKPSTIIWPVVPRDTVNAIHRGQLEIVRLLTILGWKVHVLIADCGKNNQPQAYCLEFKSKIEAYAKVRNLGTFEYTLMSDLFKPKSCDCNILHNYFQNILTELTLKDLLAINNKDYEDTVQETIKKAASLDFLRPVLTIASVMFLSQKYDSKSVVVAGYDEEIQWVRSHDILKNRQYFGVIFNPKLQTKEGFSRRQTPSWPHWYSWQNLSADMEKTNLAIWTLKLHAYLPSFPSKTIQIGSKVITADIWKEDMDISSNVNYSDLAKYVFERILNI
jgi:hypothetical protein